MQSYFRLGMDGLPGTEVKGVQEWCRFPAPALKRRVETSNAESRAHTPSSDSDLDICAVPWKRHNVIADKVSDMVHPDAVFGPLLSIKSFCGTWTYPAHQSTKSLCDDNTKVDGVSFGLTSMVKECSSEADFRTETLAGCLVWLQVFGSLTIG
ncbi:hypothetical protein BD777DRAFT_134509 [Yarrowia lipolytica]|nr:hypothetical protein BD777DRAFT_134509 [Yarrowia lipolytica]